MTRRPSDLAWSIRTPRLCVRCWRPEDAPALKDALDSSLDSLRPWLPWAVDEPTSLVDLARRLAEFRMCFE
ncbi:MAG: GNAT family N-acetyltransferase, partial [Planctomycetota bacterium]